MKNVLAKVIMLPTEKATTIQKDKDYGHLSIIDKQVRNSEDYQGQHLYFTTDEEIEEGDWFMVTDFTKPEDIRQAEIDIPSSSKRHNGYRKIVASTDESLGLPRPSNEFLNKFCEVGGIWEVLVEYEQTHWKGTKLSYEDKFKLKVAPDNTITIRPIKQKESWSRDEVEKLMLKCVIANHQNYSLSKTRNWIKQNLK